MILLRGKCVSKIQRQISYLYANIIFVLTAWKITRVTCPSASGYTMIISWAQEQGSHCWPQYNISEMVCLSLTLNHLAYAAARGRILGLMDFQSNPVWQVVFGVKNAWIPGDYHLIIITNREWPYSLTNGMWHFKDAYRIHSSESSQSWILLWAKWCSVSQLCNAMEISHG